MEVYSLEYRNADKITGQLLAAAELRQVILYRGLAVFNLSEIKQPAEEVYKSMKGYYDNKANAVKHLLRHERDHEHDKLNIRILDQIIFSIDKVEDMVYDLVEKLQYRD